MTGSRRRRWRAAAIALGVLVLALAAVVHWRAPLATAALRAAAAAAGIEDFRGTVTMIGATRAVVENVSVAAALTARRIELRYEIAAVATGRIGAIAIAGARVDVAAARVFVDRLSRAPPDTRAVASPAPIPAVTVRDSLVLIETPLGRVEVAIEADVTPADDGGVHAEARLAGIVRAGDGAARIEARRAVDGTWHATLAGRLEDRGRVGGSLRLDADRAALTLDAATTDGALRLAATGDAPGLGVEAAYALDARLSLAGPTPFWDALGIAVAGGATASFALRLPAGLDASGTLRLEAASARLRLGAAALSDLSVALPLVLRRDETGPGPVLIMGFP